MRRSRVFLKIYVAFSLVLGTLAGAATAHMALEHNPQGVYCAYVPKGQSGNYTSQGDECNVIIGNLGPLVVFNAVFVSAIFLLPLALYLSVAALLRWLRRRSRG